eukprot:1169406-Rhodomonas_salina.1
MSWAGDLCKNSMISVLEVQVANFFLDPIYVDDATSQVRTFVGMQIQVEVVTLVFGETAVLPVASLVPEAARLRLYVNDEIFFEHRLSKCVDRGLCRIDAQLPSKFLSLGCNDIELFLDPSGNAINFNVEPLTSHGIHAITRIAQFGSNGTRLIDGCQTPSGDSAADGQRQHNDLGIAIHPPEVLCVVLGHISEKTPGIFHAVFSALGVVPGSTYRADLKLSSPRLGTVLKGAAPICACDVRILNCA